MCKACVKAVEDYFPDCPSEKYGEFLMVTTAFPAGKPSQIRMQLKQTKDAGCATYKEAMDYAHKQFDDAYTRMKEEDIKKSKSITKP